MGILGIFAKSGLVRDNDNDKDNDTDNDHDGGGDDDRHPGFKS